MFKQVAPNSSEARFSFVVKFFPPDPHLLDDEFTRYLFALQIKRDLQAGQLACSETTAALLSAYIVQAEIGDYLEDVYQNSVAYLQHLRLIPDQSVRFLNRVLQLHKALVYVSVLCGPTLPCLFPLLLCVCVLSALLA